MSRVEEQERVVGSVPVADHPDSPEAIIELIQVTSGEIVGLPEPKDGVFYIVSRLVAEASPKRDDLVFPFGLVRDESGTVIGCRSLGSVAPSTSSPTAL